MANLRITGLALLISMSFCLMADAGTYAYRRLPIARDQILEIAHLYWDIRWYCTPENAYGTSITNARCPYDTSSGWKEALPYCWGGDDEIYEFLEKMTRGLGAGDRDTSSSSPYYSGLVGSVDCSGYASQCFRSGRYTTSSFHNVTTVVGWDNLAPGDATNKAGSHIRLCEKYPTETGLIQVYESTGSGWQVRRRLLSRDNEYVGVRYNFTVDMPSILDVRQTGAGQVTLTWFGAATTGFRIYRSMNGVSWARVMDENTLGMKADSAVLGGLTPETTYYFRITALNGTTETSPSKVFPVRLVQGGRPPVLIVHGFDRWIRQSPTTQFHDFLVRYGQALDHLHLGHDTCDNARITRGEIDLSDYEVVIWMLGEESSQDYALNFLEKLAIQRYLRAGGNLFISGAEIGWDLIERKRAINNLEVDSEEFYEGFLKARYIKDDAGSYSVTGAPGTLFAGLSFNFDNGTQGTYDADYPDAIEPIGGSIACLTYGSGDHAAVKFNGVFPGGTEEGKVVYFGFPFETIYPESARNSVMERVMSYFFPSLINGWEIY